MNLSFRRIAGSASAVAVLMGIGVLATAAPAGAQTAQPWPHAMPAVQTTTAFNLDGTYTDGGIARPRITHNNDDTLTVDMSSQNRPIARGWVISPTQILVDFPDVCA